MTPPPHTHIVAEGAFIQIQPLLLWARWQSRGARSTSTPALPVGGQLLPISRSHCSRGEGGGGVHHGRVTSSSRGHQEKPTAFHSLTPVGRTLSAGHPDMNASSVLEKTGAPGEKYKRTRVGENMHTPPPNSLEAILPHSPREATAQTAVPPCYLYIKLPVKESSTKHARLQELRIWLI